jgi:epoxyqueuosine reductase
MTLATASNVIELGALATQIKTWGRELGFQQIGITGIDLSEAEDHLREWLAQGFHGAMTYMDKHGTKRSRPEELLPGTIRVITARMNYLVEPVDQAAALLHAPEQAYISRYALGRDYHKVLRQRLQSLLRHIEGIAGPRGHRAFVDSAPVLEKPLARNAGLGWIGKHSNLLHRTASSWFFLGEIYTDLPLPVDPPYPGEYCGSCSACMRVCPTQAIVAPYQVDARRCISYLTIELHGTIPQEFRPLIGNRIYGCDDCQLFCPWNKFVQLSVEADFKPRYGLESASLVSLFHWTETEFLRYTEGSAIRRIGYERWLRNIAVALGNAPRSATIVTALQERLQHPSELVREHVAWALQQHTG